MTVKRYCFSIVLSETRKTARQPLCLSTAHYTTVPKLAFERACDVTGLEDD